jgi:UDP-N-acetylmuramoyl-L-alanyl-D-glutamate--2,6-diaminopimelate ligase
MESYFEAKLLLFKEILSKEGIAVINNDCSYGQKVIASCQHYGIKTVTYSTLDQKSDLYAEIIEYSTQGMKISLRLGSVSHMLTLPVVGDFQVSNLLCAIGLFMDSIAKEIFDEKKLIQSIEKLKAPFGRMEHVGTTPQGGAVYIDYAHTPDALKRALLTLKKHTQKKLVVIFGCGGDRDKKKRPIMGEIAFEYADKVIVTDDNPRTECAGDIRKQIAKACPNASVIGNRADAIHNAIVDLQEGDILLIAGKGHEQGQIIGTQTFPFCDKKIARQVIQSL